MTTPATIATRVNAAYQTEPAFVRLSAEEKRDLVLRYLPVVKSEVARFKQRLPSHVEAEELHSVAITGLMRALERGVEHTPQVFGAYVRQKVRGAILDELRKWDCFTRGLRQKARAYDAAVLEVEQREGRLAHEHEVRDQLGLSVEDFDKLLEDLRPISFLSLDEALPHGDGQMSIAERLEDVNAASVVDTVLHREEVDMLHERLRSLPRMQQ